MAEGGPRPTLPLAVAFGYSLPPLTPDSSLVNQGPDGEIPAWLMPPSSIFPHAPLVVRMEATKLCRLIGPVTSGQHI